MTVAEVTPQATALVWLPTEHTSVLDAALAYRAHGWSAIPLHGLSKDLAACRCRAGAECGTQRGKHPWLSDWPSHDAVNASDVRRWYHQQVHSGVGVAMGGPRRMIAVDIDGPEGRETWAEWQEMHGPLPPTLTARSGREDGGEHYVFTVPEAWDLTAIRNKVKPAPGVDVRSQGGQIVVAPTTHYTGRIYTWVNRVAPAVMPFWLYDMLATRPEAASKPTSYTAPLRSANPDHRSKYVQAALDAECEKIRTAPDGAQNDTINAAAFSIGQLVGGGEISEGDAVGALFGAAIDGKHPRRRAEATINSGLAAGMKQPRRVPESTHAGAGYEPRNYEPSETPEPTAGPEAAETPPRDEGEPMEDNGDPGPSDYDPGDVRQPPPKKEREKPKGPRVRSFAEHIDALGAQGTHLATGYGTLDACTRGGPRVGDLVIGGGAPGAAKTTFAVNWLRKLAADGVPVAMLCADEGPGGIVTRLGQMLGFERDALEGGNAETLAAFKVRAADALRLVTILDSDDGHTVESAAEALLETADGHPCALAVDSLQTVRSSALTGDEDDKQRLDVVIQSLLKGIARAGVLVLALSELNRGAYRSTTSMQAVSDLASFKQSGGVEYGAQLALVLRSVPGESDLIDATVAKNRIGYGKPEWRMQLQFTSARLIEIPKPAAESRDDREAARDRIHERRMRAACELAVETARQRPGLKSRRDLAAAMHITGKVAFDAIRQCIVDGLLVEGGPGGIRLTDDQEPLPEAPSDFASDSEAGSTDGSV